MHVITELVGVEMAVLILAVANIIKICPKRNVSVPQVYFLYMCSHNFSGTVTFEHLISVTELKYKLGFIIYHVDDMMRYLRNLSRPYPLSHPYPSICSNHKAPNNDGYLTDIF